MHNGPSSGGQRTVWLHLSFCASYSYPASEVQQVKQLEVTLSMLSRLDSLIYKARHKTYSYKYKTMNNVKERVRIKDHR